MGFQTILKKERFSKGHGFSRAALTAPIRLVAERSASGAP